MSEMSAFTIQKLMRHNDIELNFSDDKFLEITFNSEVATREFLLKLILSNAGDNVDRIMEFDEETVKDVLRGALEELSI